MGLFKVERRERPLGGERLKPSYRKEGIRLADSEQMWAGVLCWVCSTAGQEDSALLSSWVLIPTVKAGLVFLAFIFALLNQFLKG